METTLDIGKTVKMIERNMISTVMLVKLLVHFAFKDRQGFEQIMSAISSKELESVIDVLQIYPSTEAGWSLLPKTRAEIDTSSLTSSEIGDVDSCLFQEDRASVEYIRTIIR